MKKLALGVLCAVVGLVSPGCGGTARRSAASAASGSGSVKSTTLHQRISVSLPRVVPGTRQNMGTINLRNGARFLSPTRLAIETWGSGSCPAIPNRLSVLGPDTIRIHLILGTWRPLGSSGRIIGRNRALPGMRLVPQRPNGGCTLDLRQTPMVISINPRQINVHRELTIRFYYYRSKKAEVRTAPPL